MKFLGETLYSCLTTSPLIFCPNAINAIISSNSLNSDCKYPKNQVKQSFPIQGHLNTPNVYQQMMSTKEIRAKENLLKSKI